jgi:hypothetical protein
MPDVIAVFKSDATAATRTRVINWLLPLYEEFSDISVEKAWSTTEVNEELQIPMPTVAAYCAEVELCEAILLHSEGAIADTAMQERLKNFLDTHIWVYHPDGPRTNKKGRWPDWTRGVPLYRLMFKKPLSGLENKQEEKIVNAIQAWLIRLLEEHRGGADFSLIRL